VELQVNLVDLAFQVRVGLLVQLVGVEGLGGMGQLE